MDSKYKYTYEKTANYCYEGTDTLINKLNITNDKDLFNAERELVSFRTYELNEKVEMTHKIERKVANTLRNEIIGRLNRLKEEVKDMENYVIQDVDDKNLRDEDIFRINEKIKDLEKQIINVIEG